jgi:hypothetical protein
MPATTFGEKNDAKVRTQKCVLYEYEISQGASRKYIQKHGTLQI